MDGSAESRARADSEADPRDELWVRAPEFEGWLLKRGFAWRKAWVRRWVVLQNRELAYYEKEPPRDAYGQPLASVEPRGAVTLQRDLKFVAHGISKTSATSRDFTLYPGGDLPPWEFRAETNAACEDWTRVFHRCVQIAEWLVQFKMGGLLGVGAAAVVREVCSKTNPDDKYALKIVTIHDPRMRSVALKEVEVLQRVTERIKHRNLITIKKVYQSADKLLLAMPLCCGGELYERVVNLKRFTERDAAAALYRVIDALRALHSADPPILHLDIKPENLLYESESPDAELLVTDFGLARVYEGASDITTTTGNGSSSSSNSSPDKRGDSVRSSANASEGAAAAASSPAKRRTRMVGTVGYMAPEVITQRNYSPAADLFSAGVVLYTLLVGYPPFAGKQDADVLHNTAAGKWAMPEHRGWSDVSAEAKQLVARLLEIDPLKRCTAREALENPWLAAGKPASVAAPAAAVDVPIASANVDGDAPAAAAAAAVAEGGPLSSFTATAPTSLLAADQLPVLRGSQDRMREFNDHRTTLRLSRAADFVLNHQGGGGGGEGGDGSNSILPGGLGGDSSVINLMAPQVRKRVERAFRLLSPFNGGRLSPQRFQLLARVVKAGHWPQHHLFCFFDRDGDGAVSIDDFFEAQALIRTRGDDFLFLLFQAYLAAAPPSSSLDAPNQSTSSSRGSSGGGSGGGDDTLRSFPAPSPEVARRLRQSSLNGDSLLDSGRTRSSTGAFSSDSTRTSSSVRSSHGANGITGLSPGSATRRGGGAAAAVIAEPAVGIRHVRAMFQARGLAGSTGKDFAAADRVFTAAVRAAGLLDGGSGGTGIDGKLAAPPVVAAAEGAEAATATSGPPEAVPSPQAPLTPEKKATGGEADSNDNSKSSELPETPSKAEWERLMGDLLPSASYDDASIVIKPVEDEVKGKGDDNGVASVAAAAAALNLEKKPAAAAVVVEPRRKELTFDAFARAARSVPVLVDAMIAESKNHALSAVGTADRNATPLVDSVVTEEGHREGSQGK